MSVGRILEKNYCVFVWVKNKINYKDAETLEIEYLMETLPPV